MLFRLVRVLLWLIISVLSIRGIRKSRIANKGLASILAIIMSLGLVAISSIFPFENLFISFKSPEGVFNYANYGQISGIAYGKDSCMVIFSNFDNTNACYFMPKSEKGYKIPYHFSSKKISNRFVGDGLFQIYRVNGTDDYYLFGMTTTSSKSMVILNNQGKLIENVFIIGEHSIGNTYIFYEYIECYTEDYYIVINGEKVPMAGN